MNLTAAHAFAIELRKAQEARDVTTYALADAIGFSQRQVSWWRFGRSLPQVASAVKAADALDWPELVEIVRRARTFQCHVCGRHGISEGTGIGRRYCSDSCRQHKARAGGRQVSIIDNKLTAYATAVEAFCLDCNPTGLCHDGRCPMRPVSPLPLAEGVLRVEPAAEGRKSRWDDPTARQKASEAMAAIHAATPEWRERVAEQSRARWAAMTPERRALVGQRISAAVKGKRRRAA